MDACQKHLMLPWMKAVGGRGRDRERQSCAELPALVFILCSRCVRNEAAGVLQHGEERLRSGEGLTESSTQKPTLSDSAILQTRSQSHALSLERTQASSLSLSSYHHRKHKLPQP